MKESISRAVMDKTTTAASYAASGTVGFGGLMSSDWIMVYIGVFFALLTFLVNWIYQKRRERREAEHLAQTAKMDAEYKASHDAREAEYHAARMDALKRRSTDVE